MCMNQPTSPATGGRGSDAVLLVFYRQSGDQFGNMEKVTEGHPSQEEALIRIGQIPAYCWGRVESLSGEVLEEFGRPEF